MEIVVRSAVIFFFLWALMRVMGRRELAQMSAFELVLLVVFGDLVQQGVTQEDTSVTGAVLAVGTMAILTMLISWIGFRWPAAERTLSGVAVVVIRDGVILREALALQRVDEAQLREAARQEGIASLDEVELAVLEADGRFSFVSRDRT